MAILLLLYLIAVRIKGMQENLTCVHDFVHWMGDGLEHPHDVVETAISSGSKKPIKKHLVRLRNGMSLDQLDGMLLSM